MQTGKAGKCGVGAETGKEREARMKEAERLAGYIMHKLQAMKTPLKKEP